MSSTSSKLVKMDFQPGIRRESTQYAETNSWYDTNNVRFRAGKPENIVEKMLQGKINKIYESN